MVRTLLTLLSATLLTFQDIGPSSPTKSTPQTIQIEVPQELGAKPISFTVARGLIIFSATINGQAATLLLDNGTDRSMLDTAFAQRAGMQLGPALSGANTGNARIDTRRVDGMALEIPGMLTIRGSVPSANLHEMSLALGQPISGILGGDVLDHIAVVVRPRAHQLVMVASSGVVAGANSFRIPVVANDQVDAILNGKEVRLKIDFGFNGVIRLTNTAWSRVFSTNASFVTGSQTTADGTIKETRKARAELRIGKVTDRSTPIDSDYVSGHGEDGILGNGFFSRGETVLNVSKGELIFTPIFTPK